MEKAIRDPARHGRPIRVARWLVTPGIVDRGHPCCSGRVPETCRCAYDCGLQCFARGADVRLNRSRWPPSRPAETPEGTNNTRSSPGGGNTCSFAYLADEILSSIHAPCFMSLLADRMYRTGDVRMKARAVSLSRSVYASASIDPSTVLHIATLTGPCYRPLHQPPIDAHSTPNRHPGNINLADPS